jgi:hypothetical protein
MINDEDRRLFESLRQLQDVEEIKTLRARYFFHVDAQDWNAWARDVLTEDFTFDAGGVHEGRDAVIAMVSGALAGGQTIHHGHTPIITITGPDTATGIWAMNSIVTMRIDGQEIVRRGWGHYFDDYIRTPVGWRLRRSVLRPLRVEIEHATTDTTPEW